MTVSVCRVRLLNDGGYCRSFGTDAPDLPVLVEGEYAEGSRLVHVQGYVMHRAGFRFPGLTATDKSWFGFWLSHEAEIVGPTWPRK